MMRRLSAAVLTSLLYLGSQTPPWVVDGLTLAKWNGKHRMFPVCARINQVLAQDGGQLAVQRRDLKLAGPIRRLSWALFVSTVFRSPPALAATAAAGAGTVSYPVHLGMKQLLVGISLVATFGGAFMNLMGLHNLSKDILVASVRAAAQLYLLGGLILQKLFAATCPAVVWAWIVGIGLLAANDATLRAEYTYPKLRRHMTLSVLISGIGILALSLAGNILGELQPWYQARVTIPVAGMLFGNTLSAVSIGGSSLTKGFAQSVSQLELRLARGATSEEAIQPIIMSSLRSALTPTVNSLAATGVVHIPGMMTGQVLSGQSPSQAALYQLLILFLITSTACSTVQLLARMVSHELMNMQEHRLQTTELLRVEHGTNMRRKDSVPWDRPVRSAKRLATALKSVLANKQAHHKSVTPSTTEDRVPTVTRLRSTSDEVATPILTVDGVRVERADLTLSLSLKPGDRIGISGASGIGKTQVLRTIAGLEHCEGIMELNGESFEQLKWPEWRRRVCWVSQDRPTLDGTPSEFYEDICSFRSQRIQNGTRRRPEEIASIWNLPASSFDRQWATLSGGEAQRASLAIALSLEPQVLLLDEVTSALDEATEKAVENSLTSCNIPIIMVTHSISQLDRFCTHHVNLNNLSVVEA